MKWRLVVVSVMLLQGLFTLMLFKFLDSGAAGGIAGAAFIIFGATLFGFLVKSGKWKRTVSFWMDAVYLFIGALPIYFMSLTGLGRSLIHIPVPVLVEGPRVTWMSLFIIPQKLWHKIGSTLYGVLFVCLVLEILYVATMNYLQKSSNSNR